MGLIASGTSPAGQAMVNAIDTRGANCLVAIVAGSGVSDSLGNAWGAPLFTDVDLQMYVCFNPTVGAEHTFQPGSSYMRMTVLAFDSIITTGIDGAAAHAAVSTGTTIQAGSKTPSQAATVVIAGVSVTAAGGAAPAIDSGYTLAAGALVGIAGAFGVAGAYKILSVAAAQNPTWTYGASGAAQAGLLVLKATVATGPTITGPATFNLAENATAGPTYTTDIDLGSGYPQKAGADAALFNLVSTGARQWQFQKIAAGNYEGTPDDAGANRVYDVTFVASASVSTACAITLTNVNEPPGAPTSVVATPGNASASVAFTAPAANGGPSPTSYTVTSSPGGIQASGPAAPIVVPGLNNGTPYTFSVTATSSEGTGPASAASNSVTPSPGSFTAALAAVATDYTGSTRRLNTAFDWVASPWTTPLAQATATRVSGSGTTSAVDGTASISLPTAGAWEVRQYFKDGSGNVVGMSRQFPTAA